LSVPWTVGCVACRNYTPYYRDYDEQMKCEVSTVGYSDTITV